MVGPPAPEEGLYDALTYDDEIRVLQIVDAGQSDWDAPMRCRMSKMRLSTFMKSQEISYRCLSYVWGVPEFYDIHVNDKVMGVSKNLLQFLTRIRAGSSDKNGYLWIDAICINQHDTAEKDQQVQMMGSIYSNARQVIVWLGWEWDRLGNASDNGRNVEAEAPPAPEPAEGEEAVRPLPNEFPAEQAIEYIQQIAERFRAWVANGGETFNGPLSRCAFDSAELHEMLDLPHASFRLWKAVAVFLDRHWFRRAWIVQEAALAKQMIVVCGFKIIPWDDLVQTSLFLQVSGWYERLMQLVDMGAYDVPLGWRTILFATMQRALQRQPPLQRLGQIDRLRWELLPPGMLISSDVAGPPTGPAEAAFYSMFLSIVVHVRPFAATNPRDKLYAPLALIRRVAPSLPASLPTPSYETSAQEVYIMFSKLIIRTTMDLALLSHVESESMRTATIGNATPSWVPDFSVMAHGPFSGIPEVTYDALGPTSRRIAIADLDLMVQGVRLDGIEQISQTLSKSYESRDVLSLLRFSQNFEQWYPPAEDPVKRTQRLQGKAEVLWRSLIGDCGYQQCPLSPKAVEDMGRCFKRYVEVLAAIKAYGNNPGDIPAKKVDWSDWADVVNDLRSQDPSEERPHTIPSVEELGDFAERWRIMLGGGKKGLVELASACGPSDVFGIATGRVYMKRSLFISTDGWVGLAPESSQPGDELWFLDGAKVPFVLRRVAGSTVDDRIYQVVGEAYVHDMMHGQLWYHKDDLRWQKLTLR